MKTIITIEDIRAYSEVDYIINHMNRKYVDMVPKKLLKFFSEMKDPTYEVKVNPYIPLDKQNLSHYSLELLALMHLKYWCQDETRKKELYGIMLSNDSSFVEEMLEKDSIENVFSDLEAKEEKHSEEYSRPRELNVITATPVVETTETESNVHSSEGEKQEKKALGRFKKIFGFLNKNN